MKLNVITDGTPTSPLGFIAGAAACGLKPSGNLDISLLYSERDCTAAGVFTKNQVVAAPVILDRQILSDNPKGIRGVVANAGVANACTGEQGMAAAKEMLASAANLLSVQPQQLFILSTGVIGVQLPMEKIERGLRVASRSMAIDRGKAMARAIMTTDTKSKHLAVRLNLPSGSVTIGGMAKGSGMIHPDMATMLAVITTDAIISPETLQNLLQRAVERSFNCISVDGDTSTNDTVLLLANGASGVALPEEASVDDFAEGLDCLCTELAKMIVRDGEGVTKFVSIRVAGTTTSDQAKAVAKTIATSPLVKTALAGSDPNWGRILAAAGRAGVPFDQSQVNLRISNPGQAPLDIVTNGAPTHYNESEAVEIFSRAEIDINLEIGLGEAEVLMWTGDLTHDYISINADYRT